MIQPLSPSTARRRAADGRGRAAESVVADACLARGYDLLARRLRTGAGEIDLIVADSATLIFIEVKARRDAAGAAYSIPPRQQQRLLKAAEAALAAHQDWQRANTRFDVALVCGGVLEQIEDAIRYN